MKMSRRVCGAWALAAVMGALAGGSAEAGGALRLRKLRSVDKQGIGIEAFSLLAPAGWALKGGVYWPLDNPAMPANVAFTVTSPTGFEQFQAFPNYMFFWTNNQMLLANFPAGSKYLGSVVRPVETPVQVLQRVVIPQFRKNVANLRVVGAQPLPNLARQLGAGQQTAPGVRSAATAGKVRLEYQLAAWPMEEELYAVVETHTYPLQTLQGVCTNVSWVASYLFSFRAPKGQLAGNAEKFWVMARSFRPNPQWFNKYTQLVNMLVQRQIQQIRQIGEISRIISRTNDEISDMIMRSYKQRSAVYDRLADQFSQAIRGVDAYYDPTSQGRVELPGGYDRVWSNGLGDYVLTDDANFDPNVDSNQNWTPLRRQ